jgi:hypothetical protein
MSESLPNLPKPSELPNNQEISSKYPQAPKKRKFAHSLFEEIKNEKYIKIEALFDILKEVLAVESKLEIAKKEIVVELIPHLIQQVDNLKFVIKNSNGIEQDKNINALEEIIHLLGFLDGLKNNE